MPEVHKINIELTGNPEKLLIIPEEVKVPQNDVVQWNIVGPKKYFLDLLMPRRGLIFTIYFNQESPFRWKRNFIQLFDERPFHFHYKRQRIIRLAEDVADEKGDFKYGVKVEESDSAEELYDEDPVLRVY